MSTIEQIESIAKDIWIIRDMPTGSDEENWRLAKFVQGMMEEQNSKFALFRKYGKVKEMFIAGKQLSDQAVTEAQAEKERVRLEVTNLMTQADALLAQAQTALDKAPRGKGSKADIEMLKNDLASIRTAYTEAGTDFQAGKYLAAKAKIEMVMTKAQDFIRYIEEAKTTAGGR